jgi:two-component system, cell cycle response regulator
MKVLILENSRLYQKMLSELLQELGCDVVFANSGNECLNKLQHNDFDLIFASQFIFDKTGESFIDYCRSLVSSCPIILLASEPNETLMNNASNAGIHDIFPKTNVAYLRSCISRYINGHKSIDIPGGRVIYIDHHLDMAHQVTDFLEKLNLEVTHFGSAEVAYRAFIENDVDLVITDIVMDGAMNGVTLTRLIRAQKNHRSETPILALTEHDDPARRIELFHAGINDYVTKPPIEEELAARVNNLISNKRLHDKVRAQQRALYEVAMRDQLTTCHNRHSLAESAPKYISDAVRYRFPLSLLILDLDHFKWINDEHGHSIGDVVLAEIGRLLMSACRQGDFVARIGGEEFLMLLPYCGASESMAKAEYISAQIAQCEPANLKVTTSIGAATLTDAHAGSFDNLYKAADRAVYLSKQNGRNCVTFDNAPGDRKQTG